MNKYRQGQDCKDVTASKRKARQRTERMKLEIVEEPKKVPKTYVMGLTPSQQEKIDIQKHNRKGYTTIYTVRNFVALFAVVVVYYLVELKI